MPDRTAAAGLLLATIALTACENIPYYNQSLDWFSWSRYDPEVRAIEQQTPPAQDSPVLSAPAGSAALTPAADDVILAGSAPPTMIAAAPLAGAGTDGSASTGNGRPSWQSVTPATLPPRQRITPPMGFARGKRVIYGTNRGPFQVGNVRTLR
jgi:hypothetical protein